jgi:hypothetical protein
MSKLPDQTLVTHPLHVVKNGALVGVGSGESASRLLSTPEFKPLLLQSHLSTTARASAVTKQSACMPDLVNRHQQGRCVHTKRFTCSHSPRGPTYAAPIEVLPASSFISPIAMGWLFSHCYLS